MKGEKEDVSIQEASPRPIRKYMLPLLLTLSGGAIVFFGIFYYICDDILLYTALHHETAVSKGRIVVCHLEEEYANNSVSYKCAPTVDFTTASGKKIEFVSVYEASFFSEGDTVQVNYDPRHPQDAMITSWQFWAKDLFLGGMLLLFIITVILVKRHRRKRDEK